VRFITSPADAPATRLRVRLLTLRVLRAYVAITACVNAVHLVSGAGSLPVFAAQIVILACVWKSTRSGRPFWAVIGDWLPLIALPALYVALPSTFVGPSGRLFDATVQRWDLALFGMQPAHMLAGNLPSRSLSELLHLAYLLYYVIIYLPPLLLYFGVARRGFHETMFALTVGIVVAFVAFSVFPVEGPRFEWSAPPGISSGPIRSFTLMLLERGSARGTAFPSSHLAIALVQTLSVWRWRRRLGVALAIASVLLAVGAVYGGFHYASDMLAGAAIGMGAWAVAWCIEGRVAGAAQSGPALDGSS
jgi:membrane-associated phospholipid phosphatase